MLNMLYVIVTTNLLQLMSMLGWLLR